MIINIGRMKGMMIRLDRAKILSLIQKWKLLQFCPTWSKGQSEFSGAKEKSWHFAP